MQYLLIFDSSADDPSNSATSVQYSWRDVKANGTEKPHTSLEFHKTFTQGTYCDRGEKCLSWSEIRNKESRNALSIVTSVKTIGSGKKFL